MKKIDGRSKTVRELLEKVKYNIDYYQREYKWETRHIADLLEDLEAKFLASYEEGHERQAVQNYPHYFLGSIVISHKDNQNFIIDGQQRLMSLTLLLIYLNHLQKDRTDKVDVSDLIYSEKYGRKSFNIDVPERRACIEALFNGENFDPIDQPESVRNIKARYDDIVEIFPETLKNDALPYFVDWLIDNVDMVEITAYSDDDAYTIFETMNDRGLSLSPTDMLKGYLLANIDDPELKHKSNELWKSHMLQLAEIAKGEEEDFFKSWLRAQYADTIRDRRRGAVNKDFEKIGTTFHKWVRDEHERIGLHRSADFNDFVQRLFEKYSKYYVRIRKAAQRFTRGLEYVYYNANNNFTLQYPLILSAICPEDDVETVDKRIRLVAGYVDIFIARRIVNFRTLGYSSIVYTMFNLMKKIRKLDVFNLADLLKKEVDEEMKDTTFEGMNHFYLHQQNRYRVHYLLARITHHIEEECGIESSFENYISREIRKPFEIEHIWAENKYEQYADEFDSEKDFLDYRNRIGGLLLLPRGFNQSFGSESYERKVDAYFGQNLLAKSLNERCYQKNPAFLEYIKRSGLPFKPYPIEFKKADLDERTELYRLICEEIWSPKRFNLEVE
jgi:uncharacterized protein with ParB-like and HNH nuclease domain